MKTNLSTAPNLNSKARVGLILAGIAIALISAMALLHEIRSANSSTKNAVKTTTFASLNIGLNWINRSMQIAF